MTLALAGYMHTIPCVTACKDNDCHPGQAIVCFQHFLAAFMLRSHCVMSFTTLLVCSLPGVEHTPMLVKHGNYPWHV